MHTEASQWVQFVSTKINPTRVMDQGGRNVNGSISQFFPNAEWVAVDISDGPGVDVVADCSTYVLPGCDLVTSTELFEHTFKSPQIIQCAYDSLVFGGSYIITTAGLKRPPHGQHGEPLPAKGEYYHNIDPLWLMEQLVGVGFKNIYMDVRESPSDVRAWCIK